MEKGTDIQMSGMDFSDFGREIEEKINKFVNSQEMKDLQDNIRATVENTMKEVQRSARDAAEYINKNVEARWESGQKGSASDGQKVLQYEHPYQTAALSKKRRLPVIKKPPGRFLGAFMSVLGTFGAAITWTIVLAGVFLTNFGSNMIGGVMDGAFGQAAADSVSTGVSSLGLISFGLVAVVAAACTVLAITGIIMNRRAKRFKIYMKTIGTKEFYSIEELAQATGKNEKYVIKDLKKMMLRRWFLEGHLDEQKTCFMLTDEAYQMYLDTQAELERRKKEEEQQKKEREMLEQDPVRKQLKITIEEGREYIRRIRGINDYIPGEEISGKLYRLEKVCTRIFEYIEEKPDQLSDIRKFMNYYLPTTLKLVETYYEFSTQPVQGANITTAQKEIEDMLDNINQAFETMYDKLFEESAMDISTDISVLSTMLAQEGLLDHEFK